LVVLAKISLNYTVQSARLVVPEIDSNNAVTNVNELDRPDSWTDQKAVLMRNFNCLDDFWKIHNLIR
jgi:hypothetical protein